MYLFILWRNFQDSWSLGYVVKISSRKKINILISFVIQRDSEPVLYPNIEQTFQFVSSLLPFLFLPVLITK
jgi:hypothetical protein